MTPKLPEFLPYHELFSYEGEFHLPEAPDVKFHGTLKYDPDKRIILELKGSFTGSPYIGLIHETKGLICGELNNGQLCTLYHYSGHINTIQYQGRERKNSVIEAYNLFLGESFSSLDKTSFSQATMDFSHIDYWMPSAIDVDWPKGKKDTIILTQTPTYFEVDVSDQKTSFKITSRALVYQLPMVCWPGMHVRMNYHYKFEILPETPQQYDWYIQKQRQLRLLFTLLCAEPVYDEMLLAGPHQKQIQIFDVNYLRNRPTSWTQKINTSEFILRYEELEPAGLVQTVFAGWFQMYEKYENIVNLVTSSFFRNSYLEDEFLQLVKCLEALHRIKYGGRFGLKQRLKTLLETIPRKELCPILDNPLNIEHEIKSFTARVEATRNYYTHYKESEKDLVFSIEEMVMVRRQLKMLTVYLLLQEIGIQDENLLRKVLMLHHK